MSDPSPASWTADDGDGTFTNPLFYNEFSDPDMIRVGERSNPAAAGWQLACWQWS